MSRAKERMLGAGGLGYRDCRKFKIQYVLLTWTVSARSRRRRRERRGAGAGLEKQDEEGIDG